MTDCNLDKRVFEEFADTNRAFVKKHGMKFWGYHTEPDNTVCLFIKMDLNTVIDWL